MLTAIRINRYAQITNYLTKRGAGFSQFGSFRAEKMLKDDNRAAFDIELTKNLTTLLKPSLVNFLR